MAAQIRTPAQVGQLDAGADNDDFAQQACMKLIKKLGALEVITDLGYTVPSEVFSMDEAALRSAKSNGDRTPQTRFYKFTNDFYGAVTGVLTSDLSLNLMKEKGKPKKTLSASEQNLRWERITQFMLNLIPESSISKTLISSLLQARYLDYNNGAYGLTERGFKYILMDQHQQVHNMILNYIRAAETPMGGNRNVVELLQCIFNFCLAAFDTSYKFKSSNDNL